MREEQLPLGARDAHVEQASLLLEQRRVIERLGQREQPVLEPRDEHDGKLEPLGVVQRHQRDRVGVGAQHVELRHEHRLLEEVIERRQSHLALFVGHEFRRAGDQLAHVVQPVRRLRALGAKIFVVAEGIDHLAKQFVHGGLARRLTKGADHRGELGQRGAGGRADRAEQLGARRGRQHGDPGVARGERQLLDRRLAEAALRHGDGTAKGLVVGGIRDELEVAHEIADLAAVVEADVAHEAVRDRALAQRLLERAALRVGAVDDGDVAQAERGRLAAARAQLLDDEVGLVALVEAADGGDALPAGPRGAQRLPHAAPVGADHHVREVQDFGGAAIILLEAHRVGLGKILAEVEDVPDVGAAPAVDRLVIVADHAQVAVATGELLHELVLRAIGVLVLIHKDVLEPAPIFLQLRGAVGEHAHRQHEQVVEVGGVRQAQRLTQLAIDHGGRLGEWVEGEVRELVRSYERILGVGDQPVDATRRELLRVDAVALHDALDHGLRVVLVVDRERRRAANEVRCTAQHPRADRVEGADPHADGRAAEQPADAILHLAGGLVRERHREDAAGIHAVLVDQPREPRREHPRLARSGTGQHEQRSVDVQHGLALGGVERVQQRVRGEEWR